MVCCGLSLGVNRPGRTMAVICVGPVPLTADIARGGEIWYKFYEINGFGQQSVQV